MNMLTVDHARSGVRRGESGSILVLTAVMMIVLLGITALAIDASYMYAERNRMSAAADAAALAAAFELTRQGTGHDDDVCTGTGTGPGICSNLKAFADSEAALTGFGFAHADVVMNRPPLSGGRAGDRRYVEVFVSRQTPGFFARALSSAFASFTPRARAVAGVGSSPYCIVQLDTSPTTGGSGYGIEIAAGGFLGNPGCPVSVNNHIIVHTGASITASPVYTNGPSGDCLAAGCPADIIHSASWATDPFASLPAPTLPLPNNDSCADRLYSPTPGATITATMPVGGWQCYASIGAGDKSGQTFHFVPGNYYVVGDWKGGQNTTIDCPTCVDGAGVFFYFDDHHAAGSLGGATVELGSGSQFTLPAATTGTYAGFLFFFNRLNVRGIYLGFDIPLRFSGAIYGVHSQMYFSSGTSIGLTDCTILVAGKISMGFGTFTTGCQAYAGAGPLGVSRAAVVD